MNTLEIRNALIVTQNQAREVVKANIFVEGDSISYVGDQAHDAQVIIDGTDKLVMPGLINTHCCEYAS